MMTNDSYQVLGIGGACIDLLIFVDEEFLATHVSGKKGGAYQIEDEELNQILSFSRQKPLMTAGGSCANTIKGLANLKTPCGFISRIGSDHLGKQFYSSMKKNRVKGIFSKSELTTARVLCLVTPDGQRTMRYTPGCSDELSESVLHPDQFAGIQLLHLDAYSFRNGNLVQKAMEFAKTANAFISLDLSSFEMVHVFHEKMKELINEYVDIVFANADETQTLTGLSPREGCLQLQKMCPIVVVLMGKEGCLIGSQDKIIASPSFPAHVVDTTGAGDLFASGFLYAYLNGYSLEQAGRLGNLLGSTVIVVQGAELPLDTWKEIRKNLL